MRSAVQPIEETRNTMKQSLIITPNFGDVVQLSGVIKVTEDLKLNAVTISLTQFWDKRFQNARDWLSVTRQYRTTVNLDSNRARVSHCFSLSTYV